MRALTKASFAPATVRSTTPRAASVKDPRQPTWRFRPIHSLPTPKSRSAKGSGASPRPSRTRRVVLLPQDRINDRTIRFPADHYRLDVDGTTPPDHGTHALLVRRVSDATKPQLLVDLQ